MLKGGLVITIAIAVFGCVHGKNDKLTEVFNWKEVSFTFPNDTARKSAVDSGHFNKESILPLGLEVYKDKLFITLPRWKSGIPATLAYVSLKDKSNKSPDLIPYPDWTTNNIHKSDNSTTIVSTFRIRADECDRLWVMDTGLADILGEAQRITPPKLVVYNLTDDSVIRVYNLKDDHQKDNSFFPNVVVDVQPGKCDKAFAYVPDLGSNAIIVYSWEDNDSWRVTHHYFHLDPLAGDYNIGGVNFQWVDGVFGIALSPIQKDGYRTVYFHALSSTREFSVSSRILQNETLASNSYHEYKFLGSRGPDSQATSSFLDEKSGVLFYTQVNKNGIGCWNSYKHADEYSADTNGLVTSDNETMIFPNDLKVDRDSNLWVLTDRLPIYLYKKIDPQETNYRVFTGPVKEAIKGTVCEANSNTIVLLFAGCKTYSYSGKSYGSQTWSTWAHGRINKLFPDFHTTANSSWWR